MHPLFDVPWRQRVDTLRHIRLPLDADAGIVVGVPYLPCKANSLRPREVVSMPISCSTLSFKLSVGGLRRLTARALSGLCSIDTDSALNRASCTRRCSCFILADEVWLLSESSGTPYESLSPGITLLLSVLPDSSRDDTSSISSSTLLLTCKICVKDICCN